MKHNFPSYAELSHNILILVGRKLLIKFSYAIGEISGEPDKPGEEFFPQQIGFLIKTVLFDESASKIVIQVSIKSAEAEIELIHFFIAIKEDEVYFEYREDDTAALKVKDIELKLV